MGALSFDELFPQLFLEAVREDFEQTQIPEASVIQSSWEAVARQLEITQLHRRETGSGAAQQRSLGSLSQRCR